MEKTKRETRDFVKVESFSQLPFIREAQTKQKAAGVKLFGIEFGNDEDANSPVTPSNEKSEDVDTKDGNSTANGETNRRFECHYCCRNFPTSQALGGHQNAHKRERQHAKRAHLQSSMLHGSITDYSHVYGLANYRQSSVSTAYPTWNTNNNRSIPIANGLGRMYETHGGLYNSQRSINVRPLGTWRSSTVQSSHTLNHEQLLRPLPLLAGNDLSSRPSQIVGPSSQSRFGANYVSKPSVEDHLSLDLHL